MAYPERTQEQIDATFGASGLNPEQISGVRSGQGYTPTPAVPRYSDSGGAISPTGYQSGYQSPLSQAQLQKPTPPESVASVKQRLMPGFQDQITAVRSLYNSMLQSSLQSQQKIGQESAGRARATAASTGTLGTEFGNKYIGTTATEEQKAEEAIRANVGIQEEAALERIRKEQQSNFESDYNIENTQRQNYRADQDKYLAGLKDQAATAQNEIKTIAATTDISGLDQPTMDRLFTQSGFNTPQEFQAFFGAARKAAQDPTIKIETDPTSGVTYAYKINALGQKIEVQKLADASKFHNVPAGGTAIDERTGKPVFTAPASTVALGPGQTLVRRDTGQVIAEGGKKYQRVGTDPDTGYATYAPIQEPAIGTTPAGGGAPAQKTTSGTPAGSSSKYSAKENIQNLDPIQKYNVLRSGPKVAGISQGELYNAAIALMLTGTPQGIASFGGANVRKAVGNKQDEIMRAYGLNEFDVLSAQQDFKTYGQSLSKLRPQYFQIVTAEENANKDFQLAGQKLQPLFDIGSPKINGIVRDFQNDYLGNTDTQPFINALLTAADNYARVVSGGTTSGQLHESARADAKRRISEAVTKGQFAPTLATMQQEMENRKTSFEDQIANISGSFAKLLGINPKGGGGARASGGDLQSLAAQKGFDLNEARKHYSDDEIKEYLNAGQ